MNVRSKLNSDVDKKVCVAFKVQLFEFVDKLDQLLENKKLGKDIEFLDAIADLLILIDKQSGKCKGCGEELDTAALLVQNMLTHPLDIEGIKNGNIDLITAANAYKKEKQTSSDFCKVMVACVHNEDETQLLLTSLKLIAYDI